MQNEKNWTQKTTYYMIPLYKMPRIGKFTEIESILIVAGVGAIGECVVVIMGTGIFGGIWLKCFKVSGEGCTTLYLLEITESCMLER